MCGFELRTSGDKAAANTTTVDGNSKVFSNAFDQRLVQFSSVVRDGRSQQQAVDVVVFSSCFQRFRRAVRGPGWRQPAAQAN
jgi:hypothetical protein